MKAIVYDGELKSVSDWPEPRARQGWARIRVRLAGICKTDLEILKGYMGFRGVLGHEFVGVVEERADAEWAGRRVVGEINAACGECGWCAADMGRHCPSRTVLGIEGLDGCLAERCALPVANLRSVPDGISDERAVFVEPLSAACEILEQIPLDGSERVVVLGDGKLGILCAWALSTRVDRVTLAGHHPEKLALAQWRGVETALSKDAPQQADVVVEATGSPHGLAQAIEICRPRGTIALKSTLAATDGLNLAPLVVDEITLVGSRCGRFEDGLAMLTEFPGLPVERLVTARYRLGQAREAFARASAADALKVLVEP